MKAVFLTTTLLLLTSLTFVPSASAGPDPCTYTVSVDELQNCANIIIDSVQYTGGEKYREVQEIVHWACVSAFGEENCQGTQL